MGGLYVDLHDFCDKLGERASQLSKKCDDVSTAIDAAVTAHAGIVDGRVVEVVNDEPVKSGNPGLLSHGLSIYFPYLKDGKEKDYIKQDLVKGIPRMVDKDSEMMAGYQALNAGMDPNST